MSNVDYRNGHSLLKTDHRDLTLTGADRVQMIDNLVELASRVSPPIDVPAEPQGIDVYNGSYQYAVGSKVGIQVQTDKSVLFGEKNWGNPPEQVESGWASLLAKINNWSRAETITALARKQGINLKTPMELSKAEMARSISGNEIPVPYGDILIDGEKAVLKRTLAINFPYRGRQYILAVFQTPCGKVAHIPFHKAYDLPENDPCAFRWGFQPNDIPLSELDTLEAHPEATVIMVDDPWLALQINQTLAFIAPENRDVVAVSFWAGCSRLEAYNFMPLQGRKSVNGFLKDLLLLLALQPMRLKQGTLNHDSIFNGQAAESIFVTPVDKPSRIYLYILAHRLKDVLPASFDFTQKTFIALHLGTVYQDNCVIVRMDCLPLLPHPDEVQINSPSTKVLLEYFEQMRNLMIMTHGIISIRRKTNVKTHEAYSAMLADHMHQPLVNFLEDNIKTIELVCTPSVDRLSLVNG